MEYKSFLDKNRDVINKFCEITSRKVGIIDEYGQEDWESVAAEKQRCIEKISSTLGISQRFMDNLFLENERMEVSGAPRDILISQMGQYLRFALSKTNDEYIDLSQFFIKLYFEDLDKIFKDFYKTKGKNLPKETSLNDMSGVDFEGFIEHNLKDLGYDVRGTPKTGDQGADVIASKNNRKYIIQAKRYTKPVGNKAVQEIVAAKNYYQGDFAIVVTNSTFTRSAKALAQKNNVLLIEGDQLPEIGSILESLS
ncbi:MAG: restriction endonuclease [Candidatus Microgenomates bacterium]|jgi:hypothetical protein